MIIKPRAESDELNSGFTLVELILVIAIMSIVGLILGTLITTGVNLYQRQNKDLNLQTRSQLLQSQITTYITNADLGIYAPEVFDTVFFPTKNVTTIFATLSLNEEYYKEHASDLASDYESGKIHAKACVIGFCADNNTVYYFTGFGGATDGLPVTAVFENGKVVSVTADFNSIAGEDITKGWPVLSDHVSAFDFDYKSGDEAVNVRMKIEYSSREYNYDFTVALRNDTSLYGANVSSDSD